MAKRSRWLTGCAVGCALGVVAGLVGLGGAAVWVGSLMSDADDAQAAAAELAEEVGQEGGFAPPAAPAVPAERLEAFLRVRAALGPFCAEAEQVMGRLSVIREHDGRDEPPPARDILRILGGAFSMPGMAGRFLKARNEALLVERMGLEEYAWLYLLAYDAGPDPATAAVRTLDGDGDTTQGWRDRFREMLQAQRDAAGAAGEDPAWLRALDGEIGRLAADPGRRPWAEGLPGPVSESLAPHREALGQAFCPAAAEFDLSTIRRRGMAIQISGR